MKFTKKYSVLEIRAMNPFLALAGSKQLVRVHHRARAAEVNK